VRNCNSRHKYSWTRNEKKTSSLLFVTQLLLLVHCTFAPDIFCSVCANAHKKGMLAAPHRLCVHSRRARFARGARSPLITELSRPQRLALQDSWTYKPAEPLPGVSTRIAVSEELSRKLPRRRRSSTAELRPNCATKHRASVLSGKHSTRQLFFYSLY
jgi:hypothetical protein